MNNTLLKTSIKTLITFGFIYIILKKINWAEFSQLFKNIDITQLIFSIIVLTLYMFFVSFRLAIILNALKITVTLSRCITINYISIFFNNILPSKFGSDFIKVIYFKEKDVPILRPTYAVIINRLTGIISFISLNILALIIGHNIIPRWITLLTFTIDLMIIIIIIIVIRTPSQISILFNKIFPKLKNENNQQTEWQRAIDILKNNHSVLVTTILLSFVLNLTLIYLNFIYAQTLSLNIPLYYFFIFIPLTITITILPIAINGLGLKEFVIIALFTTIGVEIDEAFALSLINRVVLTCYSLIGGYFYITEKIEIK